MRKYAIKNWDFVLRVECTDQCLRCFPSPEIIILQCFKKENLPGWWRGWGCMPLDPLRGLQFSIYSIYICEPPPPYIPSKLTPLNKAIEMRRGWGFNEWSTSYAFNCICWMWLPLYTWVQGGLVGRRRTGSQPNALEGTKMLLNYEKHCMWHKLKRHKKKNGPFSVNRHGKKSGTPSVGGKRGKRKDILPF